MVLINNCNICVFVGIVHTPPDYTQDPTGVSYNSAQSGMNYLEITSDSTGRRLSPIPQNHPLIWSPGHYPHFWGTSYKPEVSMTLSMALIDLVEQPTELREPIYLKDYWFITRDIKGYKSTQLDGEINRWGTKQRSIRPHGVCGPVWWDIDMFWFPNLEVLGTFSFGFL